MKVRIIYDARGVKGKGTVNDGNKRTYYFPEYGFSPVQQTINAFSSVDFSSKFDEIDVYTFSPVYAEAFHLAYECEDIEVEFWQNDKRIAPNDWYDLFMVAYDLIDRKRGEYLYRVL